MLEYFMPICNILWPFGLFYGHLVICNSWYIFYHFGILCQEKSGNPGQLGNDCQSFFSKMYPMWLPSPPSRWTPDLRRPFFARVGRTWSRIVQTWSRVGWTWSRGLDPSWRPLLWRQEPFSGRHWPRHRSPTMVLLYKDRRTLTWYPEPGSKNKTLFRN
jgi:hypothetical protein